MDGFKPSKCLGHLLTISPFDFRYTTVNMTMDIKRNLPKEGVKWLFVRMKTTDVVEGRCDVHGQVRDEYGNLIALVQYLWFIMDASESTITRSTKESASKTSKM